MFDLIENLIDEYERKGDFTYASVSEELLSGAEKDLNIQIPEQYRWFLKKYGHGGISGIETLGVGLNGKAVFVDETIKYRSYGMPSNFIVIENCDEWLYCLNTEDEKVVMWSQGQEECDYAYTTFLEYLKDRMDDAIENL